MTTLYRQIYNFKTKDFKNSLKLQFLLKNYNSTWV